MANIPSSWQNQTTLSGNSSEEEKSTRVDTESENSNNLTALRILQYNGDYAYVCGDGWNLNHADMICEKMGYAQSADYSLMAINTENLTLLKMDSDYRPDEQYNSILSSLNRTNACHKNQIVQLACEPYGKRVIKISFSIYSGKMTPTLLFFIRSNRK